MHSHHSLGEMKIFRYCNKQFTFVFLLAYSVLHFGSNRICWTAGYCDKDDLSSDELSKLNVLEMFPNDYLLPFVFLLNFYFPFCFVCLVSEIICPLEETFNLYIKCLIVLIFYQSFESFKVYCFFRVILFSYLFKLN